MSPWKRCGKLKNQRKTYIKFTAYWWTPPPKEPVAVEDSSVFDLVPIDLREVQYKTAATEGSRVIGRGTFELAQSSCKFDYDRVLKQLVLGSGNTLAGGQLALPQDAVRADQHTDMTTDQNCMENHTRCVADKVRTAGAYGTGHFAWESLLQAEVA
jgi:hypothetical protein